MLTQDAGEQSRAGEKPRIRQTAGRDSWLTWTSGRRARIYRLLTAVDRLLAGDRHGRALIRARRGLGSTEEGRMSVYRLPRRMVAVLLVAAAAVVGSRLGASVAVGASGQPAAATGNSQGNPQAVPPSLATCNPVRTHRGLPRSHDAGRVLEHRSPLRDRPAERRPGELRQQVPGRGSGLHGDHPRRDLRRRSGDRRPLPAVSAHTQGSGAHLARGRDRRGNARHPRSDCSRRSASPPASRRSSTVTTPPISPRSRTARRRRTDSPSVSRSRQR